MTQQELLDYLRLVPEAVQDPAFYQLMFGINPETAASQDITGQNDLVKMGAGALQGLATIGNTFGNLVDPLARAIEARSGPVTLGGLLPTVDQAAQARLQGRENFNALYGGSLPAVIGKDMGLEALGGPLVRATGAALPYAGAAVNRLLQGPVASRVAGNALTGAGYGVGLTGLGASDQEGSFTDNLINSALFGAGFGAVNAAKGGQPPLMIMSGGAKPAPEPVAPRQGQAAVYSKLEDTIIKGEGAPKTAPPDKWLQYLNGAQARGLTSKEERADIGIDDWLEEKAELGQPVTRQELQQFVAENTPRFKTVVPGGGIDSHALFNIQQTANEDAQRAGLELLLMSIDNGYLEGYEGLPAVQQLIDSYSGDANFMSMEAGLITSRVGAAVFNGLQPNPDDLAKARQFYDAFALAQDADGAAPPSLTFEQFLAEAGKEGSDAYNKAFKKAFPTLWANSYYNNALDAMQRQVDDPAIQRSMGEDFIRRSDNIAFRMLSDSFNNFTNFNQVFGDHLAKPLESDAELGDLLRKTGLVDVTDMAEAEDLLFDAFGSGAVTSIRNRARDKALEDVANHYLKEKPRYEYYQWDKANARDYHERILQLQDPLTTPEGRLKKAKEMGYSAGEPSFPGGREVSILKDGQPTGQSAFGSTPEDALEEWASRETTRSKLGIDKPYTHAHWDEENPIAHWRANIRSPTLFGDDTPSYHIEEIQSDWHQQAGTAAREVGRDDYTGYRPRPGSRAQKQYEKLSAKLNEAEREHAKTYDGWVKAQDKLVQLASKQNRGETVSDEEYDAAERLANELTETKRATESRLEAARAAMPYMSPNMAAYPDAPFKNSWEPLVLKNALKEAVDRDLTRVSWTPGELQSTATGQEKNRKGNDERYNKRVANYMNDIGKKYGTKVQYQPMKLGDLPADGPVAPQAFDLSIPEQSQFAIERSDQYPFVIFKPDSESKSRGAALEQGKYYVNVSQNWWNSAVDRANISTRDMALKAMEHNYAKTNKSYDTYEEARAVAEQAYKDVVPKIPYMNLTPRLIEEIKNGNLKMY